MSNLISIITLEPSRWQEAKTLRLEALQQDPTAFGSSYEEEILYEDIRWQERVEAAYKQQNNVTLYAESSQKLVGMMGSFWSNRIKIGHIATIYGVYVSPSVRGQGVGSMLMQHVLDRLDTIPQIKKINLTVSSTQLSAQTLYKKFGFEMIGIAKHELKIGDQYYDEYLMEKLL